MPPVDRELLDLWMADIELCFMSQDEELMMTDLSVATLIDALAQDGPRQMQLFEVLLEGLR